MASYLVYMLQSTTHPSYTYVGCTHNLTRRLRQHNGELTGGAKATGRHRPWRVHHVVRGFEDARQALQFEWAWKHVRCRGIGVPRRLRQLELLMQKPRWTSNAPLASSVTLTIEPAEVFESTDETRSHAEP